MNCPVCLQTQLVMSERSGIEIDYCPSCRGVWLDRGELDKIVERAKASDAPVAQPAFQPHAQPHYGNQHRQSGPIPQPGPPPENNLYWDGYKWKRKKGWLEEIFD